jgi:L-iditol 2-dehydrogenase
LKALVINRPGSVQVVDKPRPHPGRGEVLVKIKYCGICGSDLHAFESGYLDPSLTIGHEFSGIVYSTGSECDQWKVGDYVTANNIISCGTCICCRDNRDNLCRNMRRLGITENGAMAEYAIIPEKNLVRLGYKNNLPQAALAEPLSVGLHAIKRVKINTNDRVLIIGGGTVGLIILMLLKYSDVNTVFVMEPNHIRRSYAESLGSTAAFDPGNMPTSQAIEQLTGGEGFKIIFECAGRAETIQEACNLGTAGSNIVVTGICSQTVEMSFLSLVTHEVDMITSFGKTSSEFKEAVKLIVNRSIDLSPLITSLIPIEKAGEAFKKTGDGQIKIMVSF